MPETVDINSLHLYSESWDGDAGKNRETFIGGSDVGTILGVNKFKSAYQLFLEKTGQIEKENIDDKLQVKLGHKMEQVVAELYEEEMDCKVTNSNRSYRCKEYPFLIGHIDRKVLKQKKGLEIKTTSSLNKTDYENGDVPPTHYYQCMFYMMITGIHDWDLATLRDNREFNVNHISWDEEQAQFVLEKCLEFWDCVEKREWTLPIDGLETTTNAISKLYEEKSFKENKQEIVQLNENEFSMKEYFQAKQGIKELQEITDSIENTLKVALNGAETGLLDGYTVSFKQYERKGSIDAKKIEEDYPEIDLDKYRKPNSKYRKFSIKKTKKLKEIESEDNY